MLNRFALILMLPMATGAALAQVQDNPAAASAPDRSSLFDPARHMRVSEVRPGMTGYGLSVFKGTQIQRFDVEVVSVLKNFNPKYDVVLIRCKGQFLEHTGSIAGMSGSPIFLKDDQGRYRMIGAFAYGWPLTKDPIAGVQPIEYMLRLPAARAPTLSAQNPPTTRPNADGAGAQAAGQGQLSWSLPRAGLVPFWNGLPAASKLQHGLFTLGASGRLGSDPSPQLQPLATPLMAGGLSPRLLQQVAPLFSDHGLTMLQAGEGGGGSDASQQPAKLEPGAVLAVPLLTGDVDLTAIGTVTEVIGNRVFGFGHPFNDEGAVVLPLGSGEINGVVANLQTSFKLGSLTKQWGRITTDESVGVAGTIGQDAPTVPIEFEVTGADGSSRTYHFHSVLHPRFTPVIAGLALSAAVTGQSELPQYNTLDYDLKLHFADGHEIDVTNCTTNASAQELIGEIALPLLAASENPFERVPVQKITGTVKISSQARQAQILEVTVPRSRYRAGQTVKAFVTYKPFREPEATLPIELELPHNLRQGTYQLIISDAQRYFQDEQQSKPFRFTADDIREVFGVLKDVAGIRQNAVYVRLLRHPDGVAVGRVALPELPSSRRQILLGAGRSNVTAFISSTVKSIPTDMVMSGSAEFAITIDPSARVEVVGPKAGKAAQAPTNPAAAPAHTGKPVPQTPHENSQPKDKQTK